MGMQKAIAALLSQIVIVGGYFGLDLNAAVPPELIMALSTIIVTFVTWAVPNSAN